MSDAPSQPSDNRWNSLLNQPIIAQKWVEISQDRINAFADATLDHQYIHVDTERAKKTPFGTTIAHGFLTLSLCSYFAYDMLADALAGTTSINYGLNKLRLLAPVKSGSRVRLQLTLRDVTDKEQGETLLNFDALMEIEGEEKPAFSAELLVLALPTTV